MLRNIPTGIKIIDESIGGGLHPGSINLIYGEPETGKSTLAMQFAMNCAKQHHKVLFIDCDRTFSIRRFSQLTSEKPVETAELIILATPKDFCEQATIIESLSDYVTSSFGLVVIDTFTSLYRLRISESPSRAFELNRELNRQLAILAQTAKTEKIAVLMTSQVHSVLAEVPARVEPVATRVLKFWADAIIALKPTESHQKVEITLEKTPRKNLSKTRWLIIKESGMRECSAH